MFPELSVLKYVNTNQQIADILTNGSFSRERWSQLTHLFNLITPHSQTSSYFSVLFSPAQKDDRMSKRNAEPITESDTAKRLNLSQKVTQAFVWLCATCQPACQWRRTTRQTVGNNQRQQSQPVRLAASMEEPPLVTLQGALACDIRLN